MDEKTLLDRSRRFVEEVWNRGDVAVVDELMSPAVVDHAARPAAEADREAVKAFVLAIRAGMPDAVIGIAHEGVLDDVAMQHVVVSGTHTGEVLGQPPTGNAVRFELADVYRFDADARIAEHWSVLDTGDLLRQLGAGAR